MLSSSGLSRGQQSYSLLSKSCHPNTHTTTHTCNNTQHNEKQLLLMMYECFIWNISYHTDDVMNDGCTHGHAGCWSSAGFVMMWRWQDEVGGGVVRWWWWWWCASLHLNTTTVKIISYSQQHHHYLYRHHHHVVKLCHLISL